MDLLTDGGFDYEGIREALCERTQLRAHKRRFCVEGIRVDSLECLTPGIVVAVACGCLKMSLV